MPTPLLVILGTTLAAAIVGLIAWGLRLRARLIDAEERFSHLTGHMNDVFWLEDARTGTNLYISPSYERLWGRSADALRRNPRDWFEAVHPNDRDRIQAALDDTTREVFEEQYRIVRPDGSVRWIRDRVFPIPDAAGRTHQIAGFAEDITERRTWEDALRESEARYRTLVEHAPDAIVVLDVDNGRFVDANRIAERLFGLSRRELLATGPAAMSPPRQPDGRPSAGAASDHIAEALAGGAPRFEWIHRDARGVDIPCEIRLVRMPSIERRLVRGSITDVSERRAVQQQQRRLMAELDHRVKNNLAAVLSLSQQTMATTTTMEEFRASFAGRVGALARVHEAMAAVRWAPIDIGDVVRLNLDAFERDGGAQVRVDGDRVLLPARATSPLCMALHELTTNASKYGALSSTSGRVEVKWRRSAPDRLDLEWTERDGPPLTGSPDAGFGTSLIRGFIEHELGGTVELEYPPSGLTCRLSVPLGESC